MQPRREHTGFQPTGKESKNPSALQDFFPYMVQVARKLVGRNDADDVANAALFDALRSKRPKPPLDKPLEVKRYLRRLVWFRALAHWKRIKKFRREICASPEIEYNESPSTTALNSFETFLLYHAFENGMRCLNSEERALLRAYYVEGLTAKELATSIGEIESAVRSRIDRAAQKVATALVNKPNNARSGWTILVPVDEIHQSLSRLFIRLTNLCNHLGFAKVAITVGTCIGVAIPAWHIAPQMLETPAHGLPTDTPRKTIAANPQPSEQVTTASALPPEPEQAHADAGAPTPGPPNPPHNGLAPDPEKNHSSDDLGQEPKEPDAGPSVPEISDPSVPRTVTMSCDEALNLALAEANSHRADTCRRILAENAASADPCPHARMAEALRGCNR